MKKHLKFIKIAFVSGIAAVFAILGINLYVVRSVRNDIVDDINSIANKNFDCALVLGAGVRDNKPSPMLADRLDTAIELYFKGLVPKLLMSGDHGQVDYDEVRVMRDYAISNGIPSEDIFMDHAGFSTYESIYRAKEVFDADEVIVVTQKYHLYRALYIARELDIIAYGVSSDLRQYMGQPARDVREIAARNKDFFICFFKPEPKYLGNIIPVSGDGNLTDDK